VNKEYIGNGKVVLIAGGGKVYTDIAARFVRSEKDLEDIISSPYSKEIVKNIIGSGHKAALEFDQFIFGVEGYSRVTETQLVRKRHASYMIKTGRANKSGKRSFDVVIPKSVESFNTSMLVNADDIFVYLDGKNTSVYSITGEEQARYFYNSDNILELIENWYENGVKCGIKEEELRYLKPQATEFKAIISMNATALRDWFTIRTCLNSQTEIRDMANKMLCLCKKVSPDLFEDAGASCKVLGYCPENKMQNEKCKGVVPTKNEALDYLKNWSKQ